MKALHAFRLVPASHCLLPPNDSLAPFCDSLHLIIALIFLGFSTSIWTCRHILGVRRGQGAGGIERNALRRKRKYALQTFSCGIRPFALFSKNAGQSGQRFKVFASPRHILISVWRHRPAGCKCAQGAIILEYRATQNLPCHTSRGNGPTPAPRSYLRE